MTQASQQQRYRLAAQRHYTQEVVERIRQGQTPNPVDQLRLSELRRKVLDYLAARLGIDEPTKASIEQPLSQALLDYWLDSRSPAPNFLTRQTAQLIPLAVQWEQFDQILDLATQTNGLPLPLNVGAPTVQTRLQTIAKDLDPPLPPLTFNSLLLPVAPALNIPVPPSLLLQSASNVSYIRLWRWLQEQDWLAANQETYRCLCAASGQQDLVDLQQIPQTDWQTVDQLWSQASQDSSGLPRFGLTVQAQLLLAILDPGSFSKAVGWRPIRSLLSDYQLTYSLDAPRGHLPFFPYVGWRNWVATWKPVAVQPPPARTSSGFSVWFGPAGSQP